MCEGERVHAKVIHCQITGFYNIIVQWRFVTLTDTLNAGWIILIIRLITKSLSITSQHASCITVALLGNSYIKRIV